MSRKRNGGQDNVDRLFQPHGYGGPAVNDAASQQRISPTGHVEHEINEDSQTESPDPFDQCKRPTNHILNRAPAVRSCHRRCAMSDRTRYWQRQVSAWGNSGLSQAEFCRRRRIKAVTFGWWKRKLRGTGKKARPRLRRGSAARRGRGEVDFVEVALPTRGFAGGPMAPTGVTGSTGPKSRWTLPTGPYPYEIALSSGRVIRLPRDFDPAVVSQLIAVVESC